MVILRWKSWTSVSQKTHISCWSWDRILGHQFNKRLVFYADPEMEFLDISLTKDSYFRWSWDGILGHESSLTQKNADLPSCVAWVVKSVAMSKRHILQEQKTIFIPFFETHKKLFVAREWNRWTITLIVLVLNTVSDRDPDPPLYEFLHPDPHSGVLNAMKFWRSFIVVIMSFLTFFFHENKLLLWTGT